ncbi:Gem-associated protein 2 [Caenorhabditis elegans]|uniref:Gem-associated protein 2 n=2 Tax=Caenorhabditis elegans TaxID=6239 RepID=A0A8S4QGJ8_CAEEL|nr:Gem-associated protein 2 [Caenorhabditis elegans]CAH2176098.1 Gem-associated protein 2 [Caenorhabditis elegans]
MDQEACLGPSDDFEADDVDMTSPAMSAAQYLRQMQAERRGTKNVVRIAQKSPDSTSPEAKKQKQWLESVGYQEVKKIETPSPLIPSEEWRQEKCRKFEETRAKMALKIEKFSPMRIDRLNSPEEEEWHEILLEKCLPEFQDIAGNFLNHTGTPPALRMLSQLIEYLVDWSIEEGLNRPIREWIYSLLAVIDLPLVQDVVSALRRLVKECRSLRSELSIDRKSEANEFSLFITIITIFFGQKDLADI